LRQQSKISHLDNDEFQQTHVISLFALVGMSITAVMGIIALFNNNFVLATILLISSFVFFVGYYAYKKFNNIKLISIIVLYLLYILMFYITYTGGVENTGPLWIFIVAPVALFIQGLTRGLIDIAIFVTITITIMLIPAELIAHATYSTEFKLRLLYSFLTVTFISALYEHSREKSYKQALALSEKYLRLAHLDPLTQLSNRRDALSILKREQARMLRSKDPLSIILCDIDYFKKINDKFGHNAGDAVLIELADILTKIMREQDCLARWGGEEFLFILPQTKAKSANIFAEKIQEKLQDHLVSYENKLISIKVSMGIEQLKDNQTIDEAINNADKHLYQAKNAGRNQIFPKF
jgi:diguanylate cyclase (GGDEF)-like protein